jgi:hypothetical protein
MGEDAHRSERLIEACLVSRKNAGLQGQAEKDSISLHKASLDEVKGKS